MIWNAELIVPMIAPSCRPTRFVLQPLARRLLEPPEKFHVLARRLQHAREHAHRLACFAIFALRHRGVLARQNQLRQPLGVHPRQRRGRFLDQRREAPIAALCSRLHLPPSSIASTTFFATAAAGTSYVPAASAACTAATLSIRTSDEPCDTSVAAALSVAWSPPISAAVPRPDPAPLLTDCAWVAAACVTPSSVFNPSIPFCISMAGSPQSAYRRFLESL